MTVVNALTLVLVLSLLGIVCTLFRVIRDRHLTRQTADLFMIFFGLSLVKSRWYYIGLVLTVLGALLVVFDTRSKR